MFAVSVWNQLHKLAKGVDTIFAVRKGCIGGPFHRVVRAKYSRRRPSPLMKSTH